MDEFRRVGLPDPGVGYNNDQSSVERDNTPSSELLLISERFIMIRDTYLNEQDDRHLLVLIDHMEGQR